MQHRRLPKNDKISAAKYSLLFKYSANFYQESKLFLHILLIMCRYLCRTSYAFYYAIFSSRWLLEFAWWISTANLDLVDQSACKTNQCYTLNSITSRLKNWVINCSIINDLILISVDRVIFKEKLLRRLKSIWSSLFIVSTFPQIISRKSVGHFFMMDASLIC